MSKPREDYLSWDEYFMSIALLSSQRSKDPATQVGACIINKKQRIVGIGYNGLPHGCSDKELPWGKTGDWMETKYPYVCHAEMNAILNKNQADIDGGTIFTTLYPCNECAKLIIQSGISKVVYANKKPGSVPAFDASERLLKMAGVIISKFDPPASEKSLKIDLNTGSISLDSSQQKSISKPNPLQNISNDSKIIA
ncbi:unnamed protein product [Oikopleura dioica]|uniref:Deoxycytidylate deaminase n=1 Tax=Oikopleura dioica TaxID=34765 RepID=E4Y2S3_OIKDI|nr:unnamed protein product [Oikopleura dioica]